MSSSDANTNPDSTNSDFFSPEKCMLLFTVNKIE